MAIVTTDDKWYKAIANKIRETFEELMLTPEMMPDAIDGVKYAANQEGWVSGRDEGFAAGFENGEDVGYNKGYDAGMTEGHRIGLIVGHDNGVQDEQERFWNEFQNGMKKNSAAYAFSYDRWNDTTYNPKGTLYCGWSANQMYYYSKITDTKVPISFVGMTNNVAVLFEGSTVHTINKFIVDENTPLKTTFRGANYVANVTFDGVIGTDCDTQWCPLTKKSIQGIVEHLSTTATGKTATFKKTAKEAAFTDEEWNTLIADKPNWTFSLV